MGSDNTSTARLEVRISKELHATLKRAAALQNVTMTDFVINAVREAARSAIEQTEIIRLSGADQERFAAADEDCFSAEENLVPGNHDETSCGQDGEASR